MSAPLTMQWRLPEAVEIETGRPVLGRTLTALAGAVNHINGLHARGWVQVACLQGLPAGNGFVAGEVENEGHRVPFLIPKGVAKLRFAFLGLSYETGGAADPEVDVSIYTAGAVLVDTGYTMTREDGLVPGGEIEVRGANLLIPFVGESNRTLDVTGKDGTVCVLYVDTVRCMMVGMFVMPLIEATL